MQYRTIRHSVFQCVFIADLFLFIAQTGTKAYATHTFYLDAVNGNDTTGDGSQAKPLKAFTKALTVIASRDTVLLNSGN
jgi:hypothetical protein